MSVAAGYLIPIALYVSIEMVKIVQSLVFIGQDRSMYHEETDTPAVARTSNLNEELGMVNTILSDKVGPATAQQHSTFRCFAVRPPGWTVSHAVYAPRMVACLLDRSLDGDYFVTGCCAAAAILLLL